MKKEKDRIDFADWLGNETIVITGWYANSKFNAEFWLDCNEIHITESSKDGTECVGEYHSSDKQQIMQLILNAINGGIRYE